MSRVRETIQQQAGHQIPQQGGQPLQSKKKGSKHKSDHKNRKS